MGDSADRAAREIADLRAEEATIDINNRIADTVIYELQNIDEPSNYNMMCWYKAAIDKFCDRAPAQQVRKIVDATVVREMVARRSRRAKESGKMFHMKRWRV